MTVRLPPEPSVAYVRELSADVRGVAVLDAEAGDHAEPPGLAAPARTLAETLGHGWLRLPEGLVLVARDSHGRAVVAVAGASALAGPTALDLATVLGTDPPDAVEMPSQAAQEAARAAFRAV